MTLFKFLIGNACPFLLLEPNFTHGLILAGNKLSRSCDYTRDKVSLKEISVKLFGRCLRSRFILLKNFFSIMKSFFSPWFSKEPAYTSRGSCQIWKIGRFRFGKILALPLTRLRVRKHLSTSLIGQSMGRWLERLLSTTNWVDNDLKFYPKYIFSNVSTRPRAVTWQTNVIT